MNRLLSDVLEAHGGLDRWSRFEKVVATIVTGGELWGLKGLVQDPNPRKMTVWLREQRASLTPFGAADQRTRFTPDRIAIEKHDGTVVAERPDPRASFAGHEQTTPWDGLHRAYFNGYAMWTYLTTPFLLAGPGVEVEEIAPWRDGEQTWRGLRARFPDSVATHSAVQDFYFDAGLRLRRHDYHVDVAGGFPAAQLVFDYAESQGIRFPTKRRAYMRGPDLQPVLSPLMVSIDISNVGFS